MAVQNFAYFNIEVFCNNKWESKQNQLRKHLLYQSIKCIDDVLPFFENVQMSKIVDCNFRIEVSLSEVRFRLQFQTPGSNWTKDMQGDFI